MVLSKNLNYPSSEILTGKINYELIILWMLNNNKFCRWRDFTDEPLNINQSTLSTKLKYLVSKESIKKVVLEREGRKKYYQITQKGKNRFNNLVKSQDSDEKILNYPPDEILKKRVYTDIILWMLYNNNYCQWRQFLEDPLNINPSTLSTKMKLLMNKEYVKKENIPDVQYDIYRIKPAGKQKYFEILKFYDLDRQSILDEESKRIQKLTQNTISFFEKYNIVDDDLKFRVLNNILKLDYIKVQETCSFEDFKKIVLFLAYNHPNNYPNYISQKEFSIKYQIHLERLNFFIHSIVEEELFQVKFFKLKVDNKVYYFQVNEKIEKMLSNIVEDHITKMTYLNNLYENREEKYGIEISAIIENILGEICDHLFNNDLLKALKKFLPYYISYYAYRVEKENIDNDSSDKMKALAVRDFTERFEESVREEMHERLSHTIENPREDQFEVISYYSKLEILKSSKFKNEFFDKKNLIIVKKIEKLILRREFLEAKEVLEETIDQFNTIESKILKDIIYTYLKNYDLSLYVTEEIINDMPNSYLGYLLKANTFYEKREYDIALENIEKGLRISSNTYLICQQIQILENQEKYESALKILDENLKSNPKNTPLLLSKSLIYLSQMKFKDSLRVINEALEFKPNNYELLVYKAIGLNKMEQPDKAIEILNIVLDRNPSLLNYGWVYTNLALFYKKQNKIDSALEILDKGLELDPKHPSLYKSKARCLSDLEKYDDAFLVLKKGLKIDPQFQDFYSTKAEILLKMEKNEEALETINKAFELDPTYISFYATKANILNKLKELELALETIDSGLSIAPNSSIMYLTKIRILIENRKENDTLEPIERLLEVYPENKTFLIIKAKLLFLMENNDIALKTVENGLKLNPDYTEFYVIKAQILFKEKKYEDAIQVVENGLKLSPDYTEFYVIKARILFNKKKYEDAIQAVDKGIELGKDLVRLYIMKVLLLNKIKKEKLALDVIDMALELDASDSHLYSVKSNILLQIGDFNTALETINKGIEADKLDPRLYSKKAKILRKLGKDEMALEIIDQALESHPSHTSLYDAKVRTLLKMEKSDVAVEIIDNAIELNPNDYTLIEIKSKIFHKLKRYNEELEVIEKLIEVNPDKIYYLNSKAYSLACLNREEKALTTIKKLLSLKPNNAYFIDTYGEILMMFENYTEAIKKFEKAIEIGQDDDFIYECYIKMGNCYLKLGQINLALKNLEIGKKLAEDRKDKKWIREADKYFSEINKLNT